jgi:protein phosphatase
MRIRLVGGTDVGRKRKSNQDSIFFDEAAGIGIVADGIGGRRGGEIASSIAVNALRKNFVGSDIILYEEISSFLAGAIDKINGEILAKGRADQDVAGMGTTLNCLVFVGDKVHIAHVGDSRTYLYYDHHLFQLTIDHNVDNFRARGWLQPNQVAPGTKGEALVRGLGLGPTCEVDIYQTKLKPGQIFLTCSDGLSGMVSDRKIAEIIYAHRKKIKDLPAALIAAANEAGGRDNITVLISDVREA